MKRALKLLYNDIIVHNASKLFGIQLLPKQVNYSITLKCNSDCVMCCVGENYMRLLQQTGTKPPKTELTLDELGELLRSPLFRKIRDIGIAGGEPFMVPELEDYVEVVLDSLPRLISLTISSNVFLTSRVRQLAPILHQKCRDRGVRFRISASLDGVGNVHDTIRRRENAFYNVENSLAFLQEQGIEFVTGSTMSEVNIDGAFDLWNYLKKNGIVGNFRLAVEISRLDNKRDEETFCHHEYKAWEFFSNLAHDQSGVTALERRIFYRHLIKQIEGEPRTYECRFQRESLFLGELGELAHCAVYGHAFEGQQLGKDPLNAWKSKASRDLRSKMLAEACSDCKHDYRGYIKLSDLWEEFGQKLKVPQLMIGLSSLSAILLPCKNHSKNSYLKILSGKKHVVITGWYGTETVGDKAILGGIIDLLVKLGVPEITVLSIEPFFTQNTLRELGCASLVKVASFWHPEEVLSRADGLLFGGGPMMDVVELGAITKQFVSATRKGVDVGILGCGIGPVRWETSKRACKNIIKMSSFAHFRDNTSTDLARSWCPINASAIDTCGDPADWFLKKCRGRVQQTQGVLGINIRYWPRKYAGSMSPEEQNTVRNNIIRTMKSVAVEWLERSAENRVRLIPMNTYWRGSDDREILSLLKDEIGTDRVDLHTSPAEFYGIIDEIGGCEAFIGMRYHSGVISHALGVPTVAIDYTIGGGKVSAYHMDNSEVHVIKIMDVETANVTSALNDLVLNQ